MVSVGCDNVGERLRYALCLWSEELKMIIVKHLCVSVVILRCLVYNESQEVIAIVKKYHEHKTAPLASKAGTPLLNGGKTLMSKKMTAIFCTILLLLALVHAPVRAEAQEDYDPQFTMLTLNMAIVSVYNIVSTQDRIVLEKGGISAAEGLMVSRALMYSSVYYHRTVRLAEMMLTKAADTSGLDLSEIYLMSDFDLTSAIISSGGRSSRIVRDLLDRRLYKSALVLYTIDLDEDTSTVLQRYLPYHKRRALEWEIAEAAGVDDQDVLVDIPLKSALMDMAKIGKTDVSILDREGRVRSITKYSPIAKALQTRDTLDWAMAVSAPRGKREAVERAARKVLSL